MNPDFTKFAVAIQNSNTALKISNETILEFMEYVKQINSETIKLIEQTKTELQLGLDKIHNESVEALDKVSIAQGLLSGFDSQAQLGRCFTPNIGSVHVGLLLRNLGMARLDRVDECDDRQIKYGTKATMEMKKAGIAETQTRGTGRPHDYWHEEKTINEIRRRLEKLGRLNEFLKCKTIEEIHKFIKSLN